MTTIAIALPRPLIDSRPDRGRHRTRPSLADLADRALAVWRRSRVEYGVAVASVGAVVAAVLS